MKKIASDDLFWLLENIRQWLEKQGIPLNLEANIECYSKKRLIKLCFTLRPGNNEIRLTKSGSLVLKEKGEK